MFFLLVNMVYKMHLGELCWGYIDIMQVRKEEDGSVFRNDPLGQSVGLWFHHLQMCCLFVGFFPENVAQRGLFYIDCSPF